MASINYKLNGTWQTIAASADELPLGTIAMWHKSLEARSGTARETGTATTDTTDKLIDSSATFVTNSVAAGDIVYNSTDSTYATVQSVDSETQLTLDWDAFPDGNEAYSVYPEPDVQPGWIEMDGSTISDADSPFNGMTIEDVVGSARFFRARETAGRLQADAFQGHYHSVKNSGGADAASWGAYNVSSGGIGAGVDRGTTGTYEITSPRADGPNGTPRTADETRPINISFVPIVKIKNSGDVKLATYYSVSGDNFSTLTELTSVEDADEMVIYDDSASVYKKVGIDTLRELTPTPHDTGYVTCNDWTDQLLGDTVGGNVNHGFGLNLSDLDVRVLFSTDGTDANSFEIPSHIDVHGGVGNFGFTIDQVDTNNLSIQTGSNGLRYLDSTGSPQTFTNGWSYRVLVKRW